MIPYWCDNHKYVISKRNRDSNGRCGIAGSGNGRRDVSVKEGFKCENNSFLLIDNDTYQEKNKWTLSANETGWYLHEVLIAHNKFYWL